MKKFIPFIIFATVIGAAAILVIQAALEKNPDPIHADESIRKAPTKKGKLELIAGMEKYAPLVDTFIEANDKKDLQAIRPLFYEACHEELDSTNRWEHIITEKPLGTKYRIYSFTGGKKTAGLSAMLKNLPYAGAPKETITIRTLPTFGSPQTFTYPVVKTDDGWKFSACLEQSFANKRIEKIKQQQMDAMQLITKKFKTFKTDNAPKKVATPSTSPTPEKEVFNIIKDINDTEKDTVDELRKNNQN